MKNTKRIIILAVIMSMISTAAVPTFAAEKVNLKMRQLGPYFKNHHNVIDWGEYDGNITVFQIGNEYAFCTEAGNAIRDDDGNQWIPGSTPEFDADYNIDIVTRDNSLQSKIAYLGFLRHRDNPDIWNDRTVRDWYYAMTQMMIWQSLPAQSITANGMTDGKYNSYFLNPSLTSEYESFRAGIQKELNTWSKRPVFNEQTIEVKAGETIEAVDSNEVLCDYNEFVYEGRDVIIKHEAGSNKLSVTVAGDCSRRKIVITEEELAKAGCLKYESKAQVNYVYTADNSQDMAVYGYTDPVPLALSLDVDILTGKIAIEKTKAPDAYSEKSTPEEGAVFQVYLKSAGDYSKADDIYRDIITTDSKGQSVTKKLPHGVYTVHQLKGALGHVMIKDFDVEIKSDSRDKTYTYTVENETLKSKLQIVKKDVESGRVIPRKGALYELVNVATGKQIIGPGEKGYFLTDEKGYIDLNMHLYYGKYLLTEKKAPEGYVLGAPVEFAVDGSKEKVIIEQFDKAQKGIIKVTKTGEVLSSIENKGEIYTPVYEDSPLSGVKFQVRAAENIITPDGTLRARKGEIVDTLVTKNGKAKTGELYLGEYEVIESETIDGFVIDKEPRKVTLKYEGQEIEVTEETVSFNNRRNKVRINFKKFMEEDELFGIGSEDVYKNILFGLFADEEITAADGSKIPKGGLIETTGVMPANCQYEENKDGKLYEGEFTKDIPAGYYYVREIGTDDRYILNDGIYKVSFLSTRHEETKETVLKEQR